MNRSIKILHTYLPFAFSFSVIKRRAKYFEVFSLLHPEKYVLQAGNETIIHVLNLSAGTFSRYGILNECVN